jgi:dolichol-phosphate mannosyltransferase
MSRPKPSVLLILPACEEDDIIGDLIRRAPEDSVGAICLVDDGSTDRTAEEAEAAGAVVIRHGRRRGVGAAIRSGIDYAVENGFQAVVVMAANGKDRPEEIPTVTGPVLRGEADYVQGSRWMAGGVRGNMPFYRRIATKAYPLFLSLLFRRRLTECTNGFRCYTTALCKDPRLNLHQDWLDKYELELYLHYKALKLGYRYLEVPVSKVYPNRDGRPYTKIKAFSGWWSMMRPVLLLSLHIRR